MGREKTTFILTLQLVVNTPSGVRNDSSVALLSASILQSANTAPVFTAIPRSLRAAVTALSTTWLLKHVGYK